MIKRNSGRKGFILFTCPIYIHHWRKPRQEFRQSRNLEAGPEAEAKEESCLLDYSLWLA